MIFILGIAGLVAALLISSKHGAVAGNAGSDSQSSGASFGPSPIFRQNPWQLPDIDSANQGGGYDSSYDSAFEKASGSTQVPFALLKAHAIRESSLNPNANHFDNSSVGSSYGLMQVEWIAGSGRFEKYGISDDAIGDGSLLYDPETNAFLGASIIADNMNWLHNLRDAVNAYNTGKPESQFKAPANYTDNVLAYYAKILGVSFTPGGTVS